jgi:hypothetical protein
MPRVIFEGGGIVRTMINCGGAVWEVQSARKLSASELRLIHRSCARARSFGAAPSDWQLTIDRLTPETDETVR